MKTFSEFINESKSYVIGLEDGTVLTVQNKKYVFTDNYELAYTFKSPTEAVEFEDEHSNDIDGFTYVYELKKGKLIKVDV
jgi:hypothetical protein